MDASVQLDDSAQRACIAEATRLAPVAWTCMAGVLTAEIRTAGRTRTEVKQFGSGQVQMTPPPARTTADDFGILADDYDSWCEGGTVCGRKITDYIAEVKGNGAYGVNTTVVGRIDFVVRQAFNGPYPRWRGLLIWDSGPTVRPNLFWADCRINRSGPDGFCGNVELDFSNITSTSWRSWAPSSTGYNQLSTRLSNNTTYHDDLHGSFKADGYSQTFGLGTIHTGRWRQCGPNCKYYQVPWLP
ncbi:hypothetical protein [Kribbella sp. C-35]|uniref:hypothetical protein n=1 Tax=Kribbella sp. C-35 TaxID=2789276 RepID=UPI00397C2537